MEPVIIYKEKIYSRDPRLKRHVYHDSRSKLYKFDTTGLKVSSVNHVRNIPILDQGNVGSCTGNAGIGALATDPMYASLPKTSPYSLNENGALKLYSDAEVIDGNGTYPPNDYGSCGLSIAKALKNAGVISGYQHTFTLDDALKALTVTPIIVGINWYDSMFNTLKDGRVVVAGSIAGGHEIVARQIDAPNKRVWFDNSWGSSWGIQGRFYLTFDDLGTLLSQQGDVVAFTPLSKPAPQPAPTGNTDDMTLAAAMKNWLKIKNL
mgnify:CR=1 FL=1